MTRGRKPNINPSVSLNLALPLEIRTRLDLLLYSDVEQRVPKGAYMQFFIERIGDYFTTRRADFSAPLGLQPGSAIIAAKPETLAVLEAALTK